MRSSSHIVVMVLCAFLACSRARAQPQWAGSYQAGHSELKADVSTWGEDCGPRPKSFTDPDQPKVTVKEDGARLSLVFPDRTLHSDRCWSPNPAVRVVSATGANGRWRVECKTPEGDAKRERGVYTIEASVQDGFAYLQLVEESSYDWQLKASHCVAKVRTTQRMSRGGVVSETPAAAPASCTPGPLAKLRLRPADVRIAPGERQCFTVRGTDAAGCAVPIDQSSLKWELSKPAGASGSIAGACFKAAARAAEAEGRFEVIVSANGLRDSVKVEVSVADLSDITARRNAEGDGLDVQDEGGGLVSDLGIEAAVKRSSLAVKLALSALLLGLIGLLSWYLLGLRRPKKRKRRIEEDDDYDVHAPRHSGINSLGPKLTPSGSEEQLICPTCRRGVAAGVARCPNDGSVPLPYAEFVRAAKQAAPRTCTACGAQLAAGAQFCGACGQRVRS